MFWKRNACNGNMIPCQNGCIPNQDYTYVWVNVQEDLWFWFCSHLHVSLPWYNSNDSSKGMKIWCESFNLHFFEYQESSLRSMKNHIRRTVWGFTPNNRNFSLPNFLCISCIYQKFLLVNLPEEYRIIHTIAQQKVYLFLIYIYI